MSSETQTQRAIVVFAQTPPPEHGQSRMVQFAIDALDSEGDQFQVHHINARFSENLGEIGETSLRKALLVGKYIFEGIRACLKLKAPLLYYVPGPVKWSAVIRDWIVLLSLRPFYKQTVFHWHAIGQGEWAHGSERVRLSRIRVLDSLARRISAFALDRPHASISVSETSMKDSHAISPTNNLVINNGIHDPLGHSFRSFPSARTREEHPRIRLLFFGHGTKEKGLFDAIEGVSKFLTSDSSNRKFSLTIAGGIAQQARGGFRRRIERLKSQHGETLRVDTHNFLSGDEKWDCFLNHDVFLSTSHWESFGLTTLEAIACGLVVVGANSDGVQGILGADYPYLFEVGAVDELAINLRNCCDDFFEPVTLSLREGLRKRFLQNYTLDVFSRNIRRTFESLADTNHQGIIAEAGGGQGSDDSPRPFSVQVYLADQNPGFDRSFGISRMSKMIIESLSREEGLEVTSIVSASSQKPAEGAGSVRKLGWRTRNKFVRFVTDHLHPLFCVDGPKSQIYFYPKGYLPLTVGLRSPSIVTVHDTIIQYDEDNYPKWRSRWEYRYWSLMLKHTLKNADGIMTVSNSARNQIRGFMARHDIEEKPIFVTFEPCAYEDIEQPTLPEKSDYVLHLASIEPHKRTADLVRWWTDAEKNGRNPPKLHLVGSSPPEVGHLIESSKLIVKRSFLSDRELQTVYQEAVALILTSEIEGFGLPALEAYYLGTPVCFVKGTSVEEILAYATDRGGMSLTEPESLFTALKDVMAMSPDEVRAIGLTLREKFSSDKVTKHIVEIFKDVLSIHTESLES